jgi:hypothetical protein
VFSSYCQCCQHYPDNHFSPTQCNAVDILGDCHCCGYEPSDNREYQEWVKDKPKCENCGAEHAKWHKQINGKWKHIGQNCKNIIEQAELYGNNPCSCKHGVYRHKHFLKDENGNLMRDSNGNLSRGECESPNCICKKYKELGI